MVRGCSNAATQPLTYGAANITTIMGKLRRRVIRTPLLGSMLLYIYRAKLAFGYCSAPFRKVMVWLLNSKETTNFTYHLEETNRRYLASLISDITGKEFNEILAYMDEIIDDPELKRHVEETTKQGVTNITSDREARFGRRIGWYAFVRAMKPKIIVETGVDKGLGACVLTSALMKNKEEGYAGYYYGTDINPKAGYLLSKSYGNFGEILYGDSIESLRKLDEKIDIFINDSDHSADYEAREYETVKAKLASNAIVLGDNSHTNDKLLNFALATGRRFVFFQEKPLNHWYPGAGIGIAFSRAKDS
jgi:predicted O-methyltransferase YrrM